MSATVYIQGTNCTPKSDEDFIARECPAANHAYVNEAGHLVLHCGTDSYSELAGLFKQWHHVVIDQRWLRGPGGRFVKRGS